MPSEALRGLGRARLEIPAGFTPLPLGPSLPEGSPAADLTRHLDAEAVAAGARLCLLALDVTPSWHQVLTLAVTDGVADPEREVRALAAVTEAEFATRPDLACGVRVLDLPGGPAVLDGHVERVSVPGAAVVEQARFTVTLPTPRLTALLTLATSQTRGPDPARLLAATARTLRVEPWGRGG
ncbi:hypothetical protein ACFFKU_02465 [Kineococcus gynurae]|uniref:Uncharacterized protein n=1 Tax=Kineococcus gynurae TaxID=452979 RepID=A0ABV5LSH0_9ACTN